MMLLMGLATSCNLLPRSSCVLEVDRQELLRVLEKTGVGHRGAKLRSASTVHLLDLKDLERAQLGGSA